jgi:GGDEF domain-containing protein
MQREILTHLCNQRLFWEPLGIRNREGSAKKSFLLVIDLDNFKISMILTDIFGDLPDSASPTLF